MFNSHHPDRFKMPKKQLPACKKLHVNGNTYTEPEDLLKCWHDHFVALGKSKLPTSNMSSREPSDFINSDLLFKSSLHNEDFVLDYEIEMEEVVAAVKGMRNGKSSGTDGISAEHLKHGGPGICAWLKRIFNSIIILESIPPSLIHSLIFPIFKGKVAIRQIQATIEESH